MAELITLENHVKFSKSMLWKCQQDYFHEQGIHAWASQVPFYITSNPFIANCYAQVAIAYIEDLLQKNQINLDEPLYLIELGTGSGRFSYYCMKRLFQLQEELGLTKVKLCYIMSDFTDNNVKFWKVHNKLTPYLNENKLDFAIFNLENDQKITLINSGVTLEKNTVANPIIAMGNYIFDTISHDAFRVASGQINQLLTKVETDPDNIENNQPKKLDKLVTTFHPKAINPENYYKHAEYNDVLKGYAQRFQKTSFLFPVGGLRTINTMKSWNNKLLLISTDKGYSTPEELDRRLDPKVVFHGSFSMMVNFHAMGEYSKKCGGDVFHQSIRKSIKTSVFAFGDTFQTLKRTKHAIHQYIEEFGPGDFFNVHEHMRKTYQSNELKNIISHLHLSLWDPHVYRYFSEKITKDISKADDTILRSLVKGMPNLIDNIYMMPNAHNTFFDVGVFYHAIKDYRSALIYYKKATAHYGEQFTTLFNSALCQYSLNDHTSALDLFKRAQTLNPSSEAPKEWIEKLEVKN